MRGIEIVETSLPTVLVLAPHRFSDHRGFLAELFRRPRGFSGRSFRIMSRGHATEWCEASTSRTRTPKASS
jgi:hypothetical protein